MVVVSQGCIAEHNKTAVAAAATAVRGVCLPVRVGVCLFVWAGCERRAWSPPLGCGGGAAGVRAARQDLPQEVARSQGWGAVDGERWADAVCGL